MPERHLTSLTDPGQHCPSVEPAAQPVERGDRPGTVRGSRQPRVLLVDDHVAWLKAEAAYLSHRGYDVCCAQTLEQAAVLLAKLRFSAVVTDLHLTGGMDADGLELCQHVRTHHPEARIVLLTGAAEAGVEAEASRLGLNAVIFKPCPLQRLGNVLDELTRRSGGGSLTHDASAAGPVQSPHTIVTTQGYHPQPPAS
jgi:DNA-binding response OmpR family regulator